ncbi:MULTISPECIES: Y4bD/Y4pK family protein, partial [Bradyrhizobium]
ARAHRNIPSGESDESPAIEVTVCEPAHPLFGRTFRVIRRSVHRGGGFPLSYEVEYRDGASLLIPVAAIEPQMSMENRTKLSVEALHDLTSLVEQLEHDANRSEKPLGHAVNGTAAPNRQRGRRSAGGGKS